MIIKAVGIDAAFANMGFAQVTIDTQRLSNGSADNEIIVCKHLQLTSTAPEDQKVVRKSSDRLRRAQELREALDLQCMGNTFAFVEIPSGTQNANAAFGLGIAVGVLASCPIPIVECNPMEVKAAVAGMRVKKGATKAEVIKWAVERWPAAPWLRVRGNKNGALVGANEHLADALATVVAGIKTPEFKRLITLMAATNAVPDTSNIRPAPYSKTRRRISMDIL